MSMLLRQLKADRLHPCNCSIWPESGMLTVNITYTMFTRRIWLFYNITLASCPWGPVTANGVDILMEMYALTNRLTNGFLGNIYGFILETSIVAIIALITSAKTDRPHPCNCSIWPESGMLTVNITYTMFTREFGSSPISHLFWKHLLWLLLH